MRRLLLAISLVILPVVAYCQYGGPDVPDSLSFQGVLIDTTGTAVPDGSYNLLFKMYKGAAEVWQQNHQSTIQLSNRIGAGAELTS